MHTRCFALFAFFFAVGCTSPASHATPTDLLATADLAVSLPRYDLDLPDLAIDEDLSPPIFDLHGVIVEMHAKVNGTLISTNDVTHRRMGYSSVQGVFSGTDHQLAFSFPDDVLTTLTCGLMHINIAMSYLGNGEVYTANENGGACSITLTAWGPVGALVQGTFTADLNEVGNNTTVVHVTEGAFTAIRAE